jgi:uncharacterized protein YfbU (UPF0304 family)
MFTDLRLSPDLVPIAPGLLLATSGASADEEVAEILVMYSFIERCVSLLPSRETALLAGYPDGAFAGFEACHEPDHYRAARTLIGQSGFFDEFRALALGAAVPMLGRYRRLLRRFDLERQTGFAGDVGFSRIRHLLSVH